MARPITYTWMDYPIPTHLHGQKQPLPLLVVDLPVGVVVAEIAPLFEKESVGHTEEFFDSRQAAHCATRYRDAAIRRFLWC